MRTIRKLIEIKLKLKLDKDKNKSKIKNDNHYKNMYVKELNFCHKL